MGAAQAISSSVQTDSHEVSLSAVFSVVTQRLSPQTCGKERKRVRGEGGGGRGGRVPTLTLTKYNF